MQYLKTIGFEQPKHLIALSPWVDVSMSGKRYGEYIKKDPLVSLLFGSNIGLPDTLIFVGIHEIFYPDIIDYYE